MNGFLELQAGAPDPVTGVVAVDVTASSTYLSLDLSPGALCLRPILPAPAVGFLACRGDAGLAAALRRPEDRRRLRVARQDGFDGSAVTRQDHVLGTIGVKGFTQQICSELGGVVETETDPHPGVCIGPLMKELEPSGSSPVGSVFLGGLGVELSFESSLPCGDEGAGPPPVAGLVSDGSRTTIEDVNAVIGEELVVEESGEPFRCEDWGQEDGPGVLVFTSPAIHAASGGDLVIAIRLDD